MSGICGIVRLDGSRIEASDLAALTGPLERRGPEGTSDWQDGTAGLGHTLLATTPEALVEKLPLTDPDSGCTITADVRLDNRQELLPELGLEQAGRVVGDGELILRAYLRWGEDCPKHLLGDFAFAIWDPRSQQLFCARDHMGMRQLIYHHDPGRLFVFATEAEAVLAHAGVPRRINEARIADFLANLDAIDLTSTFFEQVSRLQPAHRLCLNATSVAISRYWALEPPPPLNLPSDSAYAAAFLEVFTEAVRCRLRSAGPVSAMLSGGIDSSSVVAVAVNLLTDEGRGPLQTISAVSAEIRPCPESSTIEQLQTLPGIQPFTVRDVDIGSISPDLIRYGTTSGEPGDGYMTLIRAIDYIANSKGAKVLLDGLSGDVVLTTSNYLAQLLRKGRFRAAWAAAKGEQAFWGKPGFARRTIARAAWVAFFPGLARAILSRLRMAKVAAFPPSYEPVASDFAKRIGLGRRLARARGLMPSALQPGPQWRAATITHAYTVLARERYDRVAAAMAVEPRDPFLDLRLLELCLSFPESQLQRDGWPKSILRASMEPFLPSSVIWRKGKTHLGWQFTRCLFKSSNEWRAELRTSESMLRHFVSHRALTDALAADVDDEAGELATNLFYLAAWLQRNAAAVH